jgi:glycosyltransferase involved in cell wall biosynthesis
MRRIRARAGYENWELCAADDCSPAPHVRRVLEEYARKDKRIKTVFRAAKRSYSAASNSALEIAAGEFVGLLDHDDELTPTRCFTWRASSIVFRTRLSSTATRI